MTTNFAKTLQAATVCLAFLACVALRPPAAKAEAPYTVEWIRQLGTSRHDYSSGVSADGLGSVYISGHTGGSLGGPNAGGGDAVVSKYDSGGSLLWTRQLGTSSDDHSRGVSADGLGSVYISGWTDGSLGGPNAGYADAFVSKYDSGGSLLWTQQLGTSESDHSFGVSADGLGNVYISGPTYGSLGGPNAGYDDAFVSKYDSGGSLLWTQQLGTSDYDVAFGVSADGLGHVYISGYTKGSLGGPNAGASDAFVSKYDSGGSLLWTQQLGTSTMEASYSVSADRLGNVFIGGNTFGSLGGPNAGGTDAFVSKYDAAGNLLWTQQLGTSSEDRSQGVSADGLGNVYISGSTFGGSLGGPNAGWADAFVSKYDAAGNLLWTQQLGTSSGDYSWGVSADGLGNVYISGGTEGSLGGPNAGDLDAFVAKLVIPERSALVFREGKLPGGLLIPGWDHVGLCLDGRVYESHQGYPASDEYYDPDTGQKVSIVFDNGVQWRHTLGSFRHDSTDPDPGSSPVRKFEEVPIPVGLAELLVTKIESKADAGYLDWYQWPTALFPIVGPMVQKGYVGGKFSCCGIIERAAEEAGHGYEGEGFIPDEWESIIVPFYPVSVIVPIFSPGLLCFAATHPDANPSMSELLRAVFHPVDFMLVDPLGRRFGYTEDLGLIDEIPGALYTGDGALEQLLILDPVPGQYVLELFGLGEDAFAAIGSSTDGSLLSQFLDDGQVAILNVTVVPEPATLSLLALGGLGLIARRRRLPPAFGG